MDVREIIDRLKKKDEEALSYLFDNYAAALNGIILRILASEKHAEEVLQQTFFKIWDKIDQYDESKSTLFTWMSRIAKNSAIDVKRLKTYQNSQKTESFKIEEHNHQNIQTNISAIDAKILIENLEEKHRLVIDYIYLRGYSQSQTAEALQIPLGTVKTRLRYAMIELRELLKHEKNLFFGLSIIILIITHLCL